jgi:hypothetical protein
MAQSTVASGLLLTFPVPGMWVVGRRVDSV